MADTGVEAHDLFALFSSDKRDFLVRNNGDQVEISSLYGKVVGIYFSAQCCDNCRRFNPELVEVYQQVASFRGFEVVYVSGERDDESFNKYFSEMPWLAVPVSDYGTMKQVKDVLGPRKIPNLVLLDPDGRVSTRNGTEVVRTFGATGYPFTGERIKFMKETAMKNQTLSSLLALRSGDFLLSEDGDGVPIAALEGKTVALYFGASYHWPCTEFVKELVDVYSALKERGEEFEVVTVSVDNDEEEFKLEMETFPWLTLPYNYFTCQRLMWYFEIDVIPTLLVVGPDGKTVNTNAAKLVKKHGVNAFPFTEERAAAIKRAKEESRTLESLLVSGDDNFVIRKDGSKVPVSELVGKNILLYFSAHWCTYITDFTAKLVEVYHEIKADDNAFEVIFISNDSDEPSYESHYSEMPWLALPYGDERIGRLEKRLKVNRPPEAIAIGPTGQIVTKYARNLIHSHGAKAYPFTKERLECLDELEEEKAKMWPQTLRHELHTEHELVLDRDDDHDYSCVACQGTGTGLSFSCQQCEFDLHPRCALKRHEPKPAKADPQCSYTVRYTVA